MLLKRVTLTDFGVLRGRQTFDLAPRSKYGKARPIVLIGGQNGAGKTTLLEAVRLALYGKLALGEKTTDAVYRKHLRDRVHRNKDALIQANAASVHVEFDWGHRGVRHVYTVERAWTMTGQDGVEERFSVSKDDRPLDDVESQHWESFIRSLVPSGLSQLFFFDGEKIQRLAEDESDVEVLASSIRALLGLDLVTQLQLDLDVFEGRHLRGEVKNKDGKLLTATEREVSSLNERAAELTYKAAEIQNAVTKLDKKILDAETQLAARGKGLADQRSALETKITTTNDQIDLRHKEVRELLEGEVVVAVCTQLCKETVRQLDGEQRLHDWHLTRNAVESTLASVAKQLTGASFSRRAGLGKKVRTALGAELDAMAQRLGEPPSDIQGITSVHELSGHDANQCRSWITSSLTAQSSRARELVRDLSKLEARLRDAKRRLDQTPDQVDLAPLIEKLSRWGAEKGKLTEQHRKLLEERRLVERQVAQQERELERIRDRFLKKSEWQTMLQLGRQSRRALEDYLRELSRVKAKQLEQTASDTFGQLCRKKNLVGAFSIDPQSFAVRLSDRHGREIAKADLSAGEKQIYAISLLWSLAKVSGRPLPMIVDTPLGRLDSRHRDLLMELYFPHASHQVIVLSTDTEVDQHYYEKLGPHLSHAVYLDHHEAEGWTEVVSGYFWEKRGGSHASA